MTRQEMREAIRPLMSEERYRHSLGVEKDCLLYTSPSPRDP